MEPKNTENKETALTPGDIGVGLLLTGFVMAGILVLALFVTILAVCYKIIFVW